jgi:hypothetical protein
MLKNIYKKIFPIKLRYLIYSLRKLSNNQNIPREIANLKKEILFLKITHYFENNPSDKYQAELKFINEIGTLVPFPYQRIKNEPCDIIAEYDKKKRLPFVLHNNRRLYFPKHYTVKQARDEYIHYISFENIFAEKFWEKTPHQYTTESFAIKDGDIVLDIGASEGIFLLDAVDKIKKGYIFEPDKIWSKPLKATFEPYQEKITIINKFVTDKDTTDEITIDSCLKNEHGNIFIKIDVEGGEKSVLDGSKLILKREDDIRIACCTYHKQDDADLFDKFFKNLNYKTEFSDGYLLFYFYNNMKPPYFRKGMIRAQNSNKNKI